MLNLSQIAIFSIPILFALIHFLEFSSYYCRVAGLETGAKVLSYSYQQMFFVGTRFFFIALMPLIGFVIDTKISIETYVVMLHFCMFLAGLAYIISYLLRKKIIYIVKKKLNGNVTSDTEFNPVTLSRVFINKKLITLSSIVFCCYALGVFLAFYYALTFYEFRATISQLSGVVNGLATVLLTFIVEPILARQIDKDNPDAINMIFSLLLGRFFGVAILSHLIILLV